MKIKQLLDDEILIGNEKASLKFLRGWHTAYFHNYPDVQFEHQNQTTVIGRMIEFLEKKQHEAYSLYGFLKCPYCESKDIETGESKAYPETATQEMRCNDCNKNWVKTYGLNGYEDRD